MASNGAKKWSKAQEDAIMKNGDILISASAGSGKTTVLVERIMRLVLSGARLSRMLILVYNNQAAEELRQKISSQLYEKILTCDEEARKKLKEELDELPLCQIGTIHSFCARSIRENFDALGLEPDFEVANESELSALKQSAMSETIKELLYTDPFFTDMVEMFGIRRDEEGISLAIEKLYELASIRADEEEFFRGVEAQYENFENSPFSETVLTDIKNRASKWLPMLDDFAAKLYSDGQKNKGDAAANLAFFIQGALRINNLKDMTLYLNSYQKEKLKDDFKKLKDNIDKFLLAKKTLLFDYDTLERDFCQSREVLKRLIASAKLFKKNLDRHLLDRKKLSFTDLEHYTLALMRSERAEAIKEKFDYVFVDEYQDVNPVQEEIINLIASRGEAFFVGDVKQSIYGFRLADPTIFLSRMKNYESGAGRNISLNRNFRSREGILNFVNNLFSEVMTKELTGIDYKNSSKFETESNEVSGVEIHLFKKPEREKKQLGGVYDITKDEEEDEELCSAAQEGLFIAEQIRALVGKRTEGQRKFEYGDIAILMFKRDKRAEKIVETLIAQGIPVSAEGFVKEKKAPERELIMLLEAVSNPKNDIAFAGYLLSYFGGFNEEELADLRTVNYDAPTLYDALKREAAGGKYQDKANKVLSDLNGMRLLSSNMSAAQFLNHIVRKTNYAPYLAAKGESVQKFLSSIKGETARSIHSLLESYKAKKSEDSSSKAKSGSKVAVATIHASKGLEYPAVFVANTSSLFVRSGGFKGDLLVDNSGLVGINAFDTEKRIKRTTVSYDAVESKIRKRELVEQIRLFYVALTRAKTYLFITGQDRNLADEAACHLDFIKQAEGKIGVDIIYHECGTAVSKAAEKRVPVFTGGQEIYLNAIKKRREFVYPFAASVKAAAKYSVTVLQKEEDYTHEVFATDNRKKGIVYHKVMEHIDYSSKDAKAELERMLLEGILTPAERELIIDDEIQSCLDSDIAKLASAYPIERERAFTMYVPLNLVSLKEGDKNIGDKALVQGIIDLIIYADDIILVDFKNSNRSEEELKEAYSRQLELYKYAAEEGLSLKVGKMIIYSFNLKKCIYI
ncbi:MAG: UvrD-helicase domain-containing protein [Clostridiales bacterium]|nr:UvrD-helicase domain-containing protein [Clostridiales bacterium]